jgi:hypothetical protein
MSEKAIQNEISQAFSQDADLHLREQEVLEDASKITNFKPTKLLGRSSWWGSEQIGAFHYLGTFEGKEAVIKIQGVKPNTSEIYMLESFAKENKSKVLRPPFLYASVPWNEEKRYEALVMENINGNKIIHKPTNVSEVKRFFELYQDYRENCLHNPWIAKPEKTIPEMLESNFTKWIASSHQVYPNHPYRKPEDFELIARSLGILQKKYSGIELEFQHGHFSADDLYQVGNKVVLLSNLYWSWRVPQYDSSFAYHWYLYNLGNDDANVTPSKIEEHRKLWLSNIEALPQAKANPEVLRLALLLFETAGLIMDVYIVDTKKPIAEYLVSRTRDRVTQLIQELDLKK